MKVFRSKDIELSMRLGNFLHILALNSCAYSIILNMKDFMYNVNIFSHFVHNAEYCNTPMTMDIVDFFLGLLCFLKQNEVLSFEVLIFNL